MGSALARVAAHPVVTRSQPLSVAGLECEWRSDPTGYFSSMADPVNDPFASPPSVVSPTPTTPPPGAPPVTAEPAPAARRSRWPIVAIAAVVVAAAVVGVVVLTRDGSSSDSSSGGSVHLVTYDDDGLSISDVDGEHANRISTPDDFRPQFRPVNGQWLVAEPNGSEVDVVDLSTGDSTTIDLGHEDLAVNDASIIPGHDHVLFSAPQGGPVVAVDLTTGEAEQLSRGDHQHVIGGSDTEVAIYPQFDGDPTTLVVPFDRPSDAWEVPGRVLSWDGERTLVAVPGDVGVTVTRYDGEEATDDGVTLDTPLGGGLLSGDGGVIIDTGGAIFRVDTAAGDKETIGTLGFGVDFAFPVSDDRLFVTGHDHTALVDADGAVVKAFDATEDPDGELQPMVPFGNAFGSECLVLQPGYRPYREGVESIAVRLDDGSTVASVEGSAAIVDETGCSIVGILSGALSIDGEAIDLGGAEATAAVTPDHRYVVARDGSGEDLVFVVIDLASGVRTEFGHGMHMFATF